MFRLSQILRLPHIRKSFSTLARHPPNGLVSTVRSSGARLSHRPFQTTLNVTHRRYIHTPKSTQLPKFTRRSAITWDPIFLEAGPITSSYKKVAIAASRTKLELLVCPIMAFFVPILVLSEMYLGMLLFSVPLLVIYKMFYD